MVKPRERRPRPEPMSAEEAAEIEAKYQLLWEFTQRLAAGQVEERLGADESP